jgi:hypothetical protein
VLRFAQNPSGRMAGFRVAQLIPGIGPATAARLLDAMGEAAEAADAVAAFAAPSKAGGEWQSFVALYRTLRTPGLAWPADINWSRTGTCRSSNECTTTPRCAPPTSSSWRSWRPATVRARASWPISRSIRPKRPATAPVRRTWTRTT